MNSFASTPSDRQSILDLLQTLNEPRREFCYAKIHRCVVTQAERDYLGSVTIDSALLRAAGILPYSKVEVVNVTRRDAARIMTYAIEGPESSGVICLNGAAAHHFTPGDLAIVMAYEHVPVSMLPSRTHVVVHVDAREGVVSPSSNRIAAVQRHASVCLEDLGAPQNNRFAQTAGVVREI